MDSNNFASGDNNNSLLPRNIEEGSEIIPDTVQFKDNETDTINQACKKDEVTSEKIDENDTKLKDRIELCRNVIQSLKLELNEEKTKLQNESKMYLEDPITTSTRSTASVYKDISDSFLDQLPTATSVYGLCVDNKLNCDQNLIEYEKQLQKYQSTLQMAQLEKKNAIRKQMLAKAYRLKLLEVENQCNIELLRVKQSLQCLEPLKMIASKWKTNTGDPVYDYNNFELLPRYPDVSATSGNEVNYVKDDCDGMLEYPGNTCVETK